MKVKKAVKNILNRLSPESLVGVLEEEHYTLYHLSDPITHSDNVIANHPLPATEKELEFAYAGGENPELYNALQRLGKVALNNPKAQESIFATITNDNIAINLPRTSELDEAIGHIVRDSRPLARPRFEELT